MKDTVDAIDAAGLRDRVKVMIGGGPVTREYAEKIGADGYGANATEAVELAREAGYRQYATFQPVTW